MSAAISDADVVRLAHEYLHLASNLTDDIRFQTSFISAPDDIPGLARLCDDARRVARGGDDAMVSLTLTPDTRSSFAIYGRHARGTLSGVRTHTRLIVIAIIMGLVIVLLLCSRSRTPR